MSDLKTAAQQALDWLYDNDVLHPTKVSEDLRAALAQEPVQEPVAWIHRQGDFWEFGCHRLTDGEKARGWTEEPLYTAPPQRKPLTKEEIMRAFYAAEKTPMSIRHGLSVVESARIVERAHGIKERV